jgi:hypothetical protein
MSLFIFLLFWDLLTIRLLLEWIAALPEYSGLKIKLQCIHTSIHEESAQIVLKGYLEARLKMTAPENPTARLMIAAKVDSTG